MPRPLPSTSALIFCALLACSPADNHPTAPSSSPPNQERCEALQTEQECFAQGCDFFTSANVLLTDAADPTSCQKQTTTSVCLFAPGADDADDVLTFYQRDLEDGSRQVLQLGRDVELRGWRRCGGLDAPPDCDCDGEADLSKM